MARSLSVPGPGSAVGWVPGGSVLYMGVLVQQSTRHGRLLHRCSGPEHWQAKSTLLTVSCQGGCLMPHGCGWGTASPGSLIGILICRHCQCPHDCDLAVSGRLNGCSCGGTSCHLRCCQSAALRLTSPCIGAQIGLRQ